MMIMKTTVQSELISAAQNSVTKIVGKRGSMGSHGEHNMRNADLRYSNYQH